MNADYISRALCFHGQPLQKIWEDERGAGDLQLWGVAPHNNYTIYTERQKHFTFQDRAKRLKMHQFFSRKAIDLYCKNLKMDASYLTNDFERLSKLEYVKPYVAAMPPFEIFVNKNQDKFKRLRCMLEGLKAGDVIYGVVTKNFQTQLMVKPLCTAEPLVRYLGDITTKASVQKQLIRVPLDKKGNPRSYVTNDFVCCEVVDVSVYADRLNLTMDSTFSKNKNVKFGLVTAEELPDYYRSANNNALAKYNDCLLKTKEFLNPNYDVLYELVGINVKDTFTLMHKLKHPFPQQDYATELRHTQASKWAFRSVAEGIEHFKIGRHVEAFQCLNKALNIDPRNVEGLVARGALYANKGSFLKAVDDFEKALKLNSFHVNARKYMGETLVALGRSYEDDNRIEDAVKVYRDCLNIIPNHEQARLSLEILQQRPGSQLFDNLLNIPGTTDIDLNIIHNKKSRASHGSASSSAESGTSGSDTDSDSSGGPHTKKDLSLSPLSKRMAAQTSSGTSNLPTTKAIYSQPFFMANQNSIDSNNLKIASNEFRLDDDDETESRVRKLLQDASKYKKQKSKKSKKKKSKKSKKESRKNKTISSGNLFDNLDKLNFQDALKAITSLNVESKLNKNLQIYEQTIAQIKKRKDIIELSSNGNQRAISRGDTPPPKAPSMTFTDEQPPPPPKISKKSAAGNAATSSRFSDASTSQAASTASKDEAPRFSFVIKRPVKVDKFGLVRIATPLASNNSPVKSRSRSRSLSRRARSRHSAHSRGRYSRSSSPDEHRERNRRVSRSRRSGSRSHRRRRPRSRSRNVYGRRRTPSPFVPRGSPPRRRISRGRTRPSPPRKNKNFGNLVWQRPGYNPPKIVEGSINSDRWEHDKYSSVNEKADEGPSIEEIDEIINKAQKERKEEIIKRDKDILKKKV